LLAAVPLRAKALDHGDIKKSADRAANWLIAQHNLADGTFGKSKAGKEPGVVGLILYGLLEHPRHYTESHGPFITLPIKYLKKCQKESGAIAIDGRDTYNTALAVLGLAATNNTAHRIEVMSAREYLAKCQAKDGGFTYGDGFRGGGDLSNTWFGLFGLNGGKVAPDTLTGALDFIRRCQDNPETNPDMAAKKGEGTGGSYYKPGKSEVGTYKTRDGSEVPTPYGSMTAASLEAYIVCGLKPDAPEVVANLNWFKKHFSAKENPGAGMQGYYYYAFAAARAFTAAKVKEIEMADGKKVNWALALGEQLIALQNKGEEAEGGVPMLGSFANKEARWMEDDPVLATAYALATLDLCYEAAKH
ncbi:MAG: terpene cyclase/mutase family protein, partial [Planctomycetota bacterium]|nr:terpene cyclase/mutase family protein [Planctomycetota bacterium]